MFAVPLAVVTTTLALFAAAPASADDGNPTLTNAQPTTQTHKCSKRCHAKRDYRKARRATPREPIPTYITQCESGGYLRAYNPSGAGGRYQIMPGTWEANLPSDRFVRIALGDDGPRWSSRLLQDRVAANIYAEQGSAPWSCA